MLATQAVLKGYGVGDETATVTAASITWMLKDGAGMIGRILFAWWKGFEIYYFLWAYWWVTSMSKCNILITARLLTWYPA